MKIELQEKKIKLPRFIHCILFILMTRFYRFMLKTKFNQAEFIAKIKGGEIYLNNHRVSPKEELAMYYLSLYLIVLDMGYSKIQAANYVLDLD